MNQTQYAIIGICTLLFLVLYFACDTTPPGQHQVEKSRVLNAETIDVNTLLNEAIQALPSQQATNFQLLNANLTAASSDSFKVAVLQQISGQWFQAGHPSLAGHYAQQLAEIVQTEESWSITGTTYAICVQRSQDDKIRQFCNQRAVTAFESAISLNPAEVSHKVNLALTYTEIPPVDQPMKGVLMLVELQKSNPNNVLVLNTLARLAIRTGQYEKAVERLLQAYELEPDNKTTVCLLSEAYKALGNSEKSDTFAEQCQN